MNNKYFNKLNVEPDFLLSFNIDKSTKLTSNFNGMSKLTIGDLFYHKPTKQYLLFFLADVFNKNSFERAKFSGFCLYDLKRLIKGDDYFRKELKKLPSLSVFIEKHLSEKSLTLKQLPSGCKVEYLGNIFSNPKDIEELIEKEDSNMLIRIISLVKSILNELIFFYIKSNKEMTSISFDNIFRNSEIYKQLKKKIEENNLEYTLLVESQIFLNSLMIAEKNSNRFFLTLNEYGVLDMITPVFYNGSSNFVDEVFDKETIKNGYFVFHSMIDSKSVQDIYKEGVFDFIYDLS